MSTIEKIIYENNAKLNGNPINVKFYYVNNVGFQSCCSHGYFNQFASNGEHIILTFGEDIEKHLKYHFPNLKLTTYQSDNFIKIKITNYNNRVFFRKKNPNSSEIYTSEKNNFTPENYPF